MNAAYAEPQLGKEEEVRAMLLLLLLLLLLLHCCGRNARMHCCLTF